MIVCIHDGDEMIGIAPFQVSLMPMHGKVHRQLTFLGAPWEVDRPAFLFSRDVPTAPRPPPMRCWRDATSGTSSGFMNRMPPTPRWRRSAPRCPGTGCCTAASPSSQCPYLTFEGTWEQLLASKSQKFRKNLKASRRKLQGAGQLEYTTCAGDEQAAAATLRRVRSARKPRLERRRKGVGVSQSVEHLRFYRHLIHAFGASGQFVFRCLRLGRPVGGGDVRPRARAAVLFPAHRP